MLLRIGRLGRWVALVAVLGAPLLFLAVLRLGTDERISAVEARPAPLITGPKYAAYDGLQALARG
jgi:hypothetical protein